MLHPSIYVTTIGVIQGHGIKTSALIPAGTVVWRLDAHERLYTLWEIQTWTEEEQTTFFIHGFQCGEHEFAYTHNIDRFTNHSCDPNLGWTDDGSMTLVAIRDIQPDEEITYDYATEDIAPPFQIVCTCGSSRCRGIVSNDDYLDPAWQAHYGRHLPPYVLNAIMAARSIEYTVDLRVGVAHATG